MSARFDAHPRLRTIWRGAYGAAALLLALRRERRPWSTSNSCSRSMPPAALIRIVSSCKSAAMWRHCAIRGCWGGPRGRCTRRAELDNKAFHRGEGRVKYQHAMHVRIVDPASDRRKPIDGKRLKCLTPNAPTEKPTSLVSTAISRPATEIPAEWGPSRCVAEHTGPGPEARNRCISSKWIPYYRHDGHCVADCISANL